jgi:asparagine synthase (glutamine-hydrolysing)
VHLTEDAILRAIRTIEIPSKAQIEIASLCIPLAETIYREGFRACLSGEAADEIFGGYGNFCIQAAKQPDSVVRKLRLKSLCTMARGNFIRCNKAFMAHGVECRLPFMEDGLVESAIQLGTSDSPTGKGLLKEALRGVVPDWIIKRQKDTFQGGAGATRAFEKMFTSPVRFYNAEARRIFGYLPKN